MAQKNISVCYWYISNTNLEKICHFPELRSIKNNTFWVIFIKKYVKNEQTVLKRALLNHRRQKVNRTDPSWNLKILGATVTKNFEILKIAGSRAEFLDFDFEI